MCALHKNKVSIPYISAKDLSIEYVPLEIKMNILQKYISCRVSQNR